MSRNELGRTQIRSFLVLVTLSGYFAAIVSSTASGCNSTIVKVVGPEICAEGSIFSIHARVGVKKEDCRRFSRRLHRTFKKIQETYFRPAGSLRSFSGIVQKERVQLFADLRAYRKDPENIFGRYSRARYSGSTHTLYISLDAPDSLVRHELSHVLWKLHDVPGPYWLLEGSAYFMQGNVFAKGIRCGLDRASLSAKIRNELSRLRALKQPLHAIEYESRGAETTLDPINAALFIFFLWDRKRLLQTFREALRFRNKNRSGAKFHIPSIYEKAWDKKEQSRFKARKQAYRNWLHSSRAEHKIPGC